MFFPGMESLKTFSVLHILDPENLGLAALFFNYFFTLITVGGFIAFVMGAMVQLFKQANRP